MNRSLGLFALLAATSGLSACAGDGVFTLYRSGVSTPEVGISMENARIHIATFDADESEGYNRENCEIASKLFQAQPGVKVRYWCEKGGYRE